MDLPEAAENLRDFREQTGETPLPASAMAAEGLGQVRHTLHQFFSKT